MSDNTLQEIKDRLDIADVVSSYIPLKKSGTNLKATCPFHNEKSASLMVSPQKQIWHCFGCGEGGDVFGFVMRYENIGFKEALTILADKAGVPLPQYSGQKDESDIRSQLVRINSFASKLYNHLLFSPIGKLALEYAHRRNLNDETISAWQIGFSPNDFHALEKELAKKQVPEKDLILAGVTIKNEQGQIYDRFRNRLMFPIHNYYGEVVGFSARTLEQNTDIAKYINSPETPIYNKSKILFGLYFAKEAIRRTGEVVVVEGQMDCISAHQAEFKNTVATSGTALTSQHIVLLKRLTDTVKFCFDADTAGSNATMRAGQLALGAGLKTKIIVLPEGKDPDELISKDPQAWKQAVENAVWFIDYYLELAGKNFEFQSIEQKQFLSNTVIPLVNLIIDPIEKEHYTKKISEQFNISEQTLRSLVVDSHSDSLDSAPEIAKTILDTREALEKQLLGGLIVNQEFLDFAQKQAKFEDFEHPEIRELVSQLLERGTLNPDSSISTLAKEAQFVVESQLEALDRNITLLNNELKKSFHLLKLSQIKGKLSGLSATMKQLELKGDRQALHVLEKEFAELSNERQAHEQLL